MTAKAQKRAKAQRQRTARQSRDFMGLDAIVSDLDIPRPVRLMAGTLQQAGEYLSNSPDFETLVRRVETDVLSAVVDIQKLCLGHDVCDICEMLRYRNLLHNPNTYKETEHEGSSAVVELVSLILSAHDTPSYGPCASDSPDLDAIQAAARRCRDSGALLGAFRALQVTDPLARIGFNAVVREIDLRSLSYAHMAEETLADIFRPQNVRDECRSALGFDIQTALTVTQALEEQCEIGWRLRFDQIAEIHDLIDKDEDVGLEESDKSRARDLLSSALSTPGRISEIDPDSLAHTTGLDLDEVEAVVRFFTLETSDGTASSRVLDFFSGRSAVRTHPVVTFPDGRRTLVAPSLLTSVIRERIESAVVSDPRRQEYLAHRGRFLEKKVLDLLTPHLPGGVIHAGIEYFTPANDSEQDPDTYSKVVETDALIVVDDFAIVIESKSNGFSARSRTGDLVRLRRDLGKIVTDASTQAARMRKGILQDGGLRRRDGSFLDLGHVREVFTVAVSLEDLSSIATATTELVTGGLLPQADIPWTVSVNDLRVICEIAQRPSEIVKYLRRRTDPRATLLFSAPDELDYFMAMFDGSFYVEPDPERSIREMPHMAPEGTGTRRRYKAQKPTILTSHTDPIDAWYFYKQGKRSTPAGRPTMKAEPDLIALSDAVMARASPGWLSLSTLLLEGSSKTQALWLSRLRDLKSMVKGDGHRHMFTIADGSTEESSFVLVFAMVPNVECLARETPLLGRYLSLKKYQLRVRRAFVAVITPDGQLCSTLFDNKPYAADPQMDEEVAKSGLVSPKAMRPTPPMRRRGTKRRKK